MKNILRLFMVLLFSGLFITVKAQKKPYYNEQEKVVEAAYNELDYSMKEGLLKEWSMTHQPKGVYTMNLTIKNKGEVATIHALDRNGGDIPTQNALKSYLKEYRFPFKVPKNKSYQFQYEFKF